ncbi:MFS transporter [Gordonia mangrovi]|uniref:MFS transporter n=1 Tax=Gordonia mangrovi TaxID=2665643 RepID=UPI0021AD1122|nr:MFS transporter [Gordonia mangrovi]UVF76210.1 MFS transporter [Gordonia mangrovi]
MATLFGIRVFRRLFAAQVVSLLGTGLMTVALGLLAFDLAGADAGAVLGTALAIKMVAYVVMAPIMRAVCARWSARSVLVGADIVRVLMAAALPWVGEVWQVYLLVFALQSASATFTPTFQAVIPTVVTERDTYTRAVSASRVAYDLESVVSPMVAAALLGVMGYSYLFAGTAVGFAASATLVITSGLRSTGTRTAAVSSVGDLWDTTTAGLRIMLARPVFRGILWANVASAAATAVVVVGSVVYVRATLGLGDSVLAIALGTFGAGSILAAAALPRLLTVFGAGRLVGHGAALCAVALLGVATMSATRPTLAALLVLWFALGAGTSLITTASTQLLRDHTHDDDRDAVFTAQFSASHAAFLVTYPVAGWGPGLVGPWAMPLLMASMAAGAGVLARRTWTASAERIRAHRSPTMTTEALSG